MNIEPSAASVSTDAHAHDVSAFEPFICAVQAHFAATVAAHESAILRVSTEGLFDVYLSALPSHERQSHDCDCCRRFITRFGGLVRVGDAGEVASLVWPSNQPGMYGDVARLMAARVEKAQIQGVFMTNVDTLGVATKGGWAHFSLAVPPALRKPLNDQRLRAAIALKLQGRGTLQRGLADFDAATINAALGLLRSESLYRSEKVIAPCEWLHRVRTEHDNTRGRAQDALLWRAVASAPAGFCTPRSTMIGTLLEDIASGMSFDEVKGRFAAKMHPLQYQRPQAAPTAGNIAEGEKIIAELGLEPSLHRRFARLEDIQPLWLPKGKPATPRSGVFGHLLPKGNPTAPAIAGEAGAITWVKFQRTVLPTADQIEFLIGERMNWCALLTAVNADAPPILQWDRAEARNAVSWYVYPKDSPSTQWNVPAGEYRKVTAVTLQPSMWDGGHEHQGRSAIFIIDGAVDNGTPGVGLFPEFLRSELRPVRATIEAYSKDSTLQGKEAASACGVRVATGPGENNRVRVTSSTGVIDYVIDRWD